jgi:hypothetical protein
MKSCECGGRYSEIDGDLEIVDEYVGSFVVTAVRYRKCDSCGGILYPLETARAIEKRRDERKDELLRERPLRAFLSVSQTATTLGISRQALHKHRRIRRGFIYQTAFCGSVVYLEESVKLFKSTGDGRFRLCPPCGLSGGEYRGPAESSLLLSPQYRPLSDTFQGVDLQFRNIPKTKPRMEVNSGVR